MDSTRSPIGWEWKYLDANFIFHVQDSLVHFIQDRDGNIHRLVFKEFVGSSSGRIVLEKEMISATGIGETGKADFNAAIYPNPVSNVMNVVINPENANSTVISLHDMSGRAVFSRKYEVQSNTLSTLQIPVIDFPAGAYIVKMQVGANAISRKVIIKK
jgi:hypothetical protein